MRFARQNTEFTSNTLRFSILSTVRYSNQLSYGPKLFCINNLVVLAFVRVSLR